MTASNLPPPPTADELLSLDRGLVEQVSSVDRGLLEKQPVEAFVRSFRPAGGRPRPYNRIDSAVANDVREARERNGPECVAAYLKLALVRSLLRLQAERRLENYPPSIREQYELHIRLIARELQKRPPEYFTLDNDLYLKDLALLDERMLPGGAQLFETFSGVPRSLPARGGVAQALRLGFYLAAKMRAFIPYFEMHTDPRRMSEFTPRGWDKFYLRAAEMLERRQEIRGLIGGSWWYDPGVPKLSPQLVFLQKTPLTHGARAFRFAADADAKSAALVRSPERQEAYDQGRYIPTTYILVWCREDLLRWAREQARGRVATSCSEPSSWPL